MEPEDGDRTESPPPPVSEVSEPPPLPMNGMMGCITEIRAGCERAVWVRCETQMNESHFLL